MVLLIKLDFKSSVTIILKSRKKASFITIIDFKIMENTKKPYYIAGAIVLVALLGFVFAGRKTEAPIHNDSENTMAGESAGSVLYADGAYDLDASSSSIGWEGEYLSGLTEKGTVALKSGNLKIENGMITSGEFTIDMNTIESVPHKDLLVNHLKSDEFFGVSTYPTATFVFKKMEPTSQQGAKEGRYVVAGNLTIRGITKPISFLATLKQEGNALTASSSFAINRADWEVKYNSPTFFSNLGDGLIRDAITINLDLKADKVIQ